MQHRLSEALPDRGFYAPSPVMASTPRSATARAAGYDLSDTTSTIFDDPADLTYCPSGDDSFADDAQETGMSAQDEQKFIVSESCFLQLFKRCQQCNSCCKVTFTVRGTLVVVAAQCGTGHIMRWQSQPEINGFAAGNILLSGAILFNGASPAKVLRLLGSINIKVMSRVSYNVYQHGFFLPAVTKVWTTQQEGVIGTLGDVSLLGYGRCDSPGHSAKYLTYTFMDAATSKVVHFVQVQVGEAPEVRSSSQMESTGSCEAWKT